MLRFPVFIIALIILLGHTPLCLAQSTDLSRVNVRVVTDEADAVLAILAKRKPRQAVTEADWQRLFSSEGYLRLKKREAEMQRTCSLLDYPQILGCLSLVNRRIRHIARADVFGARANQFVVRVLFENVACPTADATDGENRREEIERNTHHVIS